jgi:YgiT-type zinc finger domain-containing protein
MNCIHCQGKMERKTTLFQINRKGYHLVLNTVPAWVCTQCGEVYFEETEVESIQGALRALDERTERLAIAA